MQAEFGGAERGGPIPTVGYLAAVMHVGTGAKVVGPIGSGMQ